MRPDSRPGLLETAKVKVRDAWRGYSDEDVTRNERIYSGQITPEDRLAYKDKRVLDVIRALSMNRVSLDMQPSPTLYMSPTYLGNVTGIGNIPDAEVDMALIHLASQNLVRWQILKGS